MKRIKLITFSLFLLFLFACLYFVVDMQTTLDSANKTYTNHKIAHHNKYYDVFTTVVRNSDSDVLKAQRIPMNNTYHSLKLKAVNTYSPLLSMRHTASSQCAGLQARLNTVSSGTNYSKETVNQISFSSLAAPKTKALQSINGGLHSTAMFADASGVVPTGDQSDDMEDPAMPMGGEWYCMLCLILIFGLYKHYK